MPNAEYFESIGELNGIDPKIYAEAYDRCRGEGRSRKYMEGYARAYAIACVRKYPFSFNGVMAERYARVYAEGHEETSGCILWYLAQKGTITKDVAAEEYGASPEVFLEKVKEIIEQSSPLTMEEAAAECCSVTLDEFMKKYLTKSIRKMY